jgi:hypothetical protein
MTSIPTGAAWRPYLRALAEAGLDVTSVGAWVAAAELSPARRRLARAAMAAAIGAMAVPAFRGITDEAEPPVPGARSGLPLVDAGIRLPEDPAEPGTTSRRRTVVIGAVLTTVAAASVGATVASRKLERRWLARLTRNGHPHPHRALAVRMAAVYAVLVVPSRLLAVRQAAKAGDPENGWTGSAGGR